MFKLEKIVIHIQNVYVQLIAREELVVAISIVNHRVFIGCVILCWCRSKQDASMVLFLLLPVYLLMRFSSPAPSEAKTRPISHQKFSLCALQKWMNKNQSETSFTRRLTQPATDVNNYIGRISAGKCINACVCSVREPVCTCTAMSHVYMLTMNKK